MKRTSVRDIEHTLENLQRIVGGYIQAIYPYDEQVAVICNEDGLFLDLEWNRVVEKYGTIKGTFFICGLDFDDFYDLTDEQIERYKKRFWNPEMLIPTPEGMIQVVISD